MKRSSKAASVAAICLLLCAGVGILVFVYRDRLVPPASEPRASPEQAEREVRFPEVHLSEAQAAECLVKVGDEFPDEKIQDEQGNKQELKASFGRRLTVVVFWKIRSSYSQAAVEDLADLEARDKGVRVLAINVDDSPGAVQEILRQANIPIRSFIDQGGHLFRRVAKGNVPRIYLLDPNGRIVWFDIDYSTATAREVRHLVRSSVGG